MKKLIPFLLLPVTLISCTTVNPYTGQTQTSKLAIGAGTGAAVGAIAGAVIGNNTGSGDSKKGALIGAGIGAAAGGGIGAYMDAQEAKIRRQLQGSGVSVSRSRNNIILNMPENVTFDSGQSQLKPQAFNTLSSVALVLKEYNKTTISVDGHTDSDGSNSYNQGLSERRAYSVSNFLNSKGVAPNRISARGYGETSPIDSNATVSGKARNRRVEVHIDPVENQF